MTVKIKTYYDFRSPYAYFADYRVRKGGLGFSSAVEWVGHPIFIDVILNLQGGREPWASFVDTLIPPKRAYLPRLFENAVFPLPSEASRILSER